MELLVLGVVVLFIVIATVKFKMHPIFSLTIAAIASGFFLGMAPKSIMSTMVEGFGNTLSGIGLVIAFGTVIGIYLEKTGSTQVLANSILGIIGLKRSPLAMNLAGFVISIPVYCDSGYIILSSLNKAISKKTGIPVLVFAIALATGLYSAHVFVPPTPGPLAAAAIWDADLGMVLIFGLLVAIPVSIAGYFWARFIGKSLQENKKELPFGLYVTNSVQEEIGLRGAEMITQTIKPNVAIVTDVCHDTTTPMINKKTEGETKIGDGPVISYAPAVQNKLRERILETAESKKIPFQRNASSRYTGTDTDAFAYSNGGVASALISLPLRYMHTTVETVHRDDVENVIRLIYETLLNIKEGETFSYFD